MYSDQSNRYRGVLAIPGVLVAGNLILCGSLFFNQCYRPVGNSIIKG